MFPREEEGKGSFGPTGGQDRTDVELVQKHLWNQVPCFREDEEDNTELLDATEIKNEFEVLSKVLEETFDSLLRAGP